MVRLQLFICSLLIDLPWCYNFLKIYNASVCHIDGWNPSNKDSYNFEGNEGNFTFFEWVFFRENEWE